MKTLLSRIAVVAVLGLVAYLGFAAVNTHGAARYSAAQKRAIEACRAFRAEPRHLEADVCRVDEFGPLTYKTFEAASAQLAQARGAFAHHDPASAGHMLLAVSASAREMDRRGSMVGALFAAKLVKHIVELVDEHGTELEDRTRREVLDNARLEAASRPFEDERLARLWLMARYDSERSPGAPRLGPGELAAEMDRDEEAYLAMEQATLRGDVPRCESAARKLGQLNRSELMAGLCAKMADAVRTRQHIERLLPEDDKRLP